nr:MAG TPA: hypothetical protein [Caudoviricetes sp.]
MKRIKIHLQACVLFTPVILLLSSTIIFVLLAVLYCYLLYRFSSTKIGSSFLRRYYHEILRLENNL